LRGGQEVTTGQDGRDCLRLDRRRLHVAHVARSLDQCRMEAQGFEGHCRLPASLSADPETKYCTPGVARGQMASFRRDSRIIVGRSCLRLSYPASAAATAGIEE